MKGKYKNRKAKTTNPLATAVKRQITRDSFQNFANSQGIGTNNTSTFGEFGFNPVTRIWLELEYAYRGTGLAALAVDLPAEDMCRAGITIEGAEETDHDVLQEAIIDLGIWNSLMETLKWSRLYGGAVAYIMVDGQDPSTPLNLDTVQEGQFRGLMPLSRWQLNVTVNDVITDLGPDFGLPKYYDIIADRDLTGTFIKVHHSRVIRFIGIDLPFHQAITENGWGESILERIWDKLIAFEAATTGASQMLAKAHLRTLKIDGYRAIVAAGGDIMDGLKEQVNYMRITQSTESMSIIDKEDDFQTDTYSFGGIEALLDKFGEQIAGILQIPVTRLFGASPGGMNATGDSDLTTYYDNLSRMQEMRLRKPWNKILDVLYCSTLGTKPPKGTRFRFNNLYSLNESEIADVATKTVDTLATAVEKNIISNDEAREELRQVSYRLGLFGKLK